jgi:ribosome-associated toxin RatA of RatAB toxin-antitoxin module
MDSLKRTHDISYMQACPDLIFRLAADVERWPEILPHYRSVKVLDEHPDARVVEMAAKRGMIPVSWKALQWTDPELRLVMYRHTGGATRGMYVEWRIEPLADGSVRVEIVHDLDLKAPLVRTAIGKFVVSRLFIKYIAGRTLRHIKMTAEQGRDE